MAYDFLVASGQLPASAGLLLNGSAMQVPGTGLRGVFANVGASTETVIITLTPVAPQTVTARRIAKAILAPGDILYLSGINLPSGCLLNGQTTDATSVDYTIYGTVGSDSGPVEAFVQTSNGSRKSVSSGGLVTTQTQGANGLFATPLPMLAWKNTDGTTLAAAASAGKFGMTVTLATAAFLLGEVANTNTKTDDALQEFDLPPWYVAGSNLTVNVNASINGAGTPGTKTAQIKCYRTASDGTQGADIGPGTTGAITVAGADIPFTITGTTLNPGDRVMFELEVVLQETGGTNINAKVNSARVS
jgi:hypothetical protein